jgi:hypothetical protein
MFDTQHFGGYIYCRLLVAVRKYTYLLRRVELVGRGVGGPAALHASQQ